MSSVATVPPYLFSQQGTFDAPFDFDVPASLEVQPYTAHATFDGSGASGAFRPCLTFYSSENVRLGRYFPNTILQPGDVAEVTYTPPFGTAAVDPTPPGSGIQYGIDNEGDWLEVGVNDIVPGHGAAGQVFKNSGNDDVGNVMRVEGLQNNPATAGMIGLIVFGNTDDGTSGHEGVGAILNGGQFGGGPAVAAILRTLAGADCTGLLVQLTGDVGANKKGMLTDSPVCFSADQGPATGTPVLAQLYLKAAGGGQHSLVARAGTTDVTLVTG